MIDNASHQKINGHTQLDFTSESISVSLQTFGVLVSKPTYIFHENCFIVNLRLHCIRLQNPQLVLEKYLLISWYEYQ